MNSITIINIVFFKLSGVTKQVIFYEWYFNRTTVKEYFFKKTGKKIIGDFKRSFLSVFPYNKRPPVFTVKKIVLSHGPKITVEGNG